MVIGTSALIAIALGEPPRASPLDAIKSAATRRISAVTLLDTGIVLRARSGKPSVPLLYELIAELAIEVVSFDQAQARLAIAAFARFGKGMGHRAQLNYGDCAVYDLATFGSEPVLATGNDFAATDLAVVARSTWPPTASFRS